MKYYQQEMVARSDGRDREEELIDLKVIVQTLWRARWIIAGSTILFGALAAVYLFMTLPTYTATAQILIDPRQVDPLAVTQVEQRNYSDILVVDSQIEVLRSRRLVVRAMLELGLFDSPPPAPEAGLVETLRNWLLAGLNFGGQATIDREPSVGEEIVSETLAPGQGAPTLFDVADDALVGGMSDGEAIEFYLSSVEPLRNAQIDGFADAVRVARVNQTYTIAISFSGTDRDFTYKAANAVAKAYLDDQLESQFEAAQRSRAWVEGQLDIHRSRLFNDESAVEAYRAENNILEVGATGSLADEQMVELNVRMIQATANSSQAKARMEQIDAIVASNDPEMGIPESMSNPVVQNLRQQYTEVSQRAAEIRGRFGLEHQIYKAAIAELTRVRSELADELLRVAQTYRNEYQISVTQEQLIREQVAQQQKTNATLNQASIRLRELESQAQSSRTAYQSLLDSANQLSQRESLPKTDARVIESARLPEQPAAPKKPMIMALGLGAGAFLGLAIVVIGQLLDDRIWTQRSLERIVGRRSIGVVPQLAIPMPSGKKIRMPFGIGRKRVGSLEIDPKVLDPFAQALKDPYAPQVEVMRSANLALSKAKERGEAGAKKEARVVSFVSCRPGEGKSTISILFATYLARSNVKVLFIDADYRRPMATRRLLPASPYGIFDVRQSWNTLQTKPSDLENGSGNTEGEELDIVEGPTLASVTYSGMNGMLNVLPGRIHTPRSDVLIEELLPSVLQGLMSQLSDEYQVIVIDLPPILVLPDTANIAGTVDAMFLVTEWGETDRSTVKMTLELAQPVWDRIEGCIINKAKVEKLQGYGTNEQLRVSYYG